MSPPALVDQVPLGFTTGSMRAPVPLPGCVSLVPISRVCTEQICVQHQQAGETPCSEEEQCNCWIICWKSLPLASRKAVSYQSPLMSPVLIGTQKRNTTYLPRNRSGSLSYCSLRGSPIYFVPYDLSVVSAFQSSQKAGWGTQRTMNADRTP